MNRMVVNLSSVKGKDPKGINLNAHEALGLRKALAIGSKIRDFACQMVRGILCSWRQLIYWLIIWTN